MANNPYYFFVNFFGVILDQKGDDSMESDTIISLQHVHKEFDGVTVVEDFNLDVKRGEFVTILGPSGCGKTTTLRMIAGFELPSTGKILLNGEDISLLPFL